ncbi:MAG: bifunctional folylpolyglutamate synthase/dihydrofolate synthase, partial [Enterococcus sp.]|nr:bifunctional folylpolyglutamate synthase/dihydrofolate synthase [Enterococcus sp.]
MIKTVEEAIEWIHSRLPFGMRPGLDRVKALLELIDNPEQNLQMIHVAGTNGKGSTVSYLSC